MLIACPACSTSYEIAPSSLGRAGRSVRCVRCQHVWFAANSRVLSEVADAYREEVGAGDPPALPPRPDQAEPSGSDPDPAMDAKSSAALADAPLPSVPDQPSTDRDIAPEPTVTTDEPAAAPAAAESSAMADAPALVPNHPGEDVAAPRTTKTADVESIAARRRPLRIPKRKQRRLPLAWTAAIASLLALNAGLIAFRTDVVRWLPQTAALYAAVGLPVNLRDLVFADVATEAEMQDGVAVLVIEGTIVSTAARAIELPRLRFAVRNDRGQEIYTWTAEAPKNALAPRARVTFRSRLASPPAEAHDVLVRFQNRRDASAEVP
jgi:predicted Zn finger-like uncharacterized protein